MMNNAEKRIDPLKRWKVAHHVFFVLIQGLILAHRDLIEAIKNKDSKTAISCFNLAIQLFWGSTAAFKFGTDYSPEEYEKIVRPTMGPPNYSEGFSDLQSVDHSTLLHLLSKLTPFFKECPKELQPAYQGYLTALHTVYENHAYVCERFVGAEGKSLLQKKKNNSTDRLMTAPDSIRLIYKNRTMKLAGVE